MPKIKSRERVGQAYGWLTVLAHIGKDQKGNAVFRFRCRCGNEFIDLGRNYFMHPVRLCACKHRAPFAESSVKATIHQIVPGHRYGNWTALEIVESSGASIIWRCRCMCGTERPQTAPDLRAGRTISCGCVRKNRIVSPYTHTSWRSLRNRCENPRSPDYARYGGRGITVCERWSSYSNFLADMGERPEGTTIDRINVNGNYEPTNCRWADAKTQANNTRKTAKKVPA